MKLYRLIPCVLCIFLLLATSCSRPDHVGAPLSKGVPVLTVSQAIEASRLGKTIQVRGEVNEVCQDEGCWMTVVDSTHGLRVTFAGSAFVVPMDLQGSIVAEGTVTEQVFDEDDAKLIAETMGWSEEDIRTIHGDTRLPMMTATGIVFENK